MILFVLGVLAWTLFEYGLHRWWLHVIAPLFSRHYAHHNRPWDYKVGPSWPAIGCYFAALWFVAVLYGLTSFALGLTLAYAFYAWVHYRCHHGITPGTFGWRWLRWLIQLHALHHRHDSKNFGVSSPLWDVVFGTFQRRK